MDVDDINEDNISDQLEKLKKEFEETQQYTKPKEYFPVEIPNYEDLVSISENVIYAELNINLISNKPNDGSDFGQNTQIYNNNYYIPVPSGQDVEKYVVSFIKHMEQSLANSTKE